MKFLIINGSPDAFPSWGRGTALVAVDEVSLNTFNRGKSL